VTEPEWLAADDPLRLLGFLGGRASDRKVRLFAGACCRRLWDLLPDPANRALVAAVEDRPDGSRADPVLWAAIEASGRRERDWTEDDGYWAVKWLGRSYYKVGVADAASAVAWRAVQRVRQAGDAAAEKAAQAALVRDIFGNPFRPVAFDSSWRTSTVAALAAGIYGDRAFDRLQALADALEDSGCADAEVLAHCRGEGPHVHGCWVVDLILGKE
jgi:hypothetical protein